MLPVWVGAILSGGVSIIGDWIKRRQELAAAKHEAKVRWEQTMADASKTSLKDEFVYAVWFGPIVLAVLGYTQFIDRFLSLLESLPQWYTGLLVTLSLASIGIQAKGKWEMVKSKVSFNENGNGHGNGSGTKVMNANDPTGDA